MIDKETAKKQVKRLGQMVGFPANSAEAAGELVIALQSAYSEAIAKAVIDATLGTANAETRCPMPAELRRMVWDRQDPEARPACKKCQGDGFRGAWRVSWYNESKGEFDHKTFWSEASALRFYDGLAVVAEVGGVAVPCSCRRAA